VSHARIVTPLLWGFVILLNPEGFLKTPQALSQPRLLGNDKPECIINRVRQSTMF
jgi:hypothetical protein